MRQCKFITMELFDLADGPSSLLVRGYYHTVEAKPLSWHAFPSYSELSPPEDELHHQSSSVYVVRHGCWRLLASGPRSLKLAPPCNQATTISC